MVSRPISLVVIYSYGDFRAATKAARSDDTVATPIEITRESCVPANKVVAFFSNPFGNLDAARQAPLRIDNALITPLPSQRSATCRRKASGPRNPSKGASARNGQALFHERFQVREATVAPELQPRSSFFDDS